MDVMSRELEQLAWLYLWIGWWIAFRMVMDARGIHLRCSNTTYLLLVLLWPVALIILMRLAHSKSKKEKKE